MVEWERRKREHFAGYFQKGSFMIAQLNRKLRILIMIIGSVLLVMKLFRNRETPDDRTDDIDESELQATEFDDIW